MALLFPAGYQFFDSNGDPLASGTITFYITGTETDKAIYSNMELTVTAANPYSLDSSGRLGVNLYGSGEYTVLVKASDSTTVFTRDDVFGWSEDGFTQSGASAVQRTIQSKLKDRVHVADFGAVGDGVTDDTLALQAAITYAMSIGAVLDFGEADKVYAITAKLTGGSNLHIEGRATIDMSGIASGARTGLEIAGSAGSGTALTGGTSVHSYTVTMSSTTGFAAGDYVQLSSSDNYDYAGSNVNVGEILRIRSVVTDTSVTFTTPIVETYSSSPVLRPVTWVENVSVKGITIIGKDAAASSQRGIALRYVNGFVIEDCTLLYQDFYQIELATAIRGTVRGGNCTSVYYDGVTGTIFYGVAVLDSTQWVDIDGVIGDRARHLVITTARSSGQGFYGQPKWINVRGCIAFDSMSGAAGRSYAFENHGFGRFIHWDNLQANGCYSFMRLENGNDNKVTKSTCNGYAYQGLIIGSSGANIKNLKILDNTIGGYTGEVTAGTPCGVRFEAVDALINVDFSGNTLDQVSNGTNGQGISIGSATTTQGFKIRHNTIRSGAASVDAYGIITASTTPNIDFDSNLIYGFRGGYSINGNNNRIHGGRIENFSAAASGAAINCTADRLVATEVLIKAMHTAINLSAASTNCLVTRNYMTGCTVTTPADTGTSNTTTGNLVV